MRRSFISIGKTSIVIGIGLILVLSNWMWGTGNSLIRVRASVDKSNITIGDRITYTLVIQYAPGIHIQQPGPGANLGQFEIKDFKIYPPQKTDTLITEKYEYQISVFDTGKYVIPPFPVAFALSDTATKYQIIRSEPLTIFVRSVLSDKNQTLKDIKPPVRIPFPYFRYGLYLALVLGIVAAVLGGYYFRKYRKQMIPFLKRETVRPAHEIALEELEQLKRALPELREQGKYKIIFTEISGILRRYLENRYFMTAMEETTFEIEQSLRELNLPEQDFRLAMAVLELADRVKFARYIPEGEELDQALEQLEQFIHHTRLILEQTPEQTEATRVTGETVASEPVNSQNQLQATSENSWTLNQSDGGEKGD